MHVSIFLRHNQRIVNRLAKDGLNEEMSSTFSVTFAIGRMREVFTSPLVAATLPRHKPSGAVPHNQPVSAGTAHQTLLSTLNIRQGHKTIIFDSKLDSHVNTSASP